MNKQDQDNNIEATKTTESIDNADIDDIDENNIGIIDEGDIALFDQWASKSGHDDTPLALSDSEKVEAIRLVREMAAQMDNSAQDGSANPPHPSEQPVPQDKTFRLIPRSARDLFEWMEVFAATLTIMIILFTFGVRVVTVEGPSMQGTLLENDTLVVSHFFVTPRQGDIVVIQVPNSTFHAPIIKRVIATEGQQVDFDFDNWIVYVDGTALDEPYMNRIGGTMRSYSILLEDLPITVEPGKIFVLGDNRNHSSDSRSASIGQVDVRNVVGRVVLRLTPFNTFGAVG